MATMSVSGVVSGMDWDSMIDEIITKAAKPAQVKVNKKTNLTNKKSLFEEMKVTMNSLQSSLSPLKLPSTYKAKTIDIERIDTSGSYKGVLTATVNADAEVNVWDVKVNKLATAQINRSKQITSSTLASTLNGLTSSTFYINMGGQKIGIDVNATDTLEALKSRINNTIKTLEIPLAVTASVVDNKLILKSDNTGLGTRTASETINYSMSGVNRLSNISVTSSDAKNLKITSNGKSYTYGTDFTVANGNEIRWKQYDRSKEVALNDTVSVNYRMAANDVYSKTGTYGTSEAEISGFDMTDNGTLSKRVKITDSDGNTYTYGKDFTIKDDKVVWLEEDEETTNEPSKYTVSYSKTETSSAVAQSTKSPVGPTNYTVSYTKTTQVASVTYSGGNQSVGSYSFDGTSTKSTFTDFLQDYADAEGLSNTSGLSQVSTGTVNGFKPTYVTGMDNISIDGYEYGKDYVLRGGATSNSLAISWNETTTGAKNFIDDYRTNILHTSTATGSSPNVGDSFAITYTHTDTYSTDGSGKPLVDVLTAALNDSGGYSGLVVKDSSSGREFSYDDGDFTVIGGQIVWLLTSDDDIDMSNVASQYNSANGTDEIPRITLTDGKGVLRTYLDLAGDSSFTMTDEDGKTYEYGRDYVVRVNDAGDGYCVTWAISSDTNGDGQKDIKDADTVLTTYAQEKNISTYGMQSAPDEDKTFELNFSKDVASTGSATVNKTDAASAKNLYSLLGLDSLDGITLSITDSSGKTYSGTDYAIDSSGNITWTDQNTDAPASYTVKFTASQTDITPDSGKVNYDSLSSGGATFLNFDGITDYGFETVDVNGGSRTVRTIDVYNPSSTQDYKFSISLKDDDGNYYVSDDYVYGRDYTVRKSEDASNPSTHTLISFYSRPEVTSYASLVTSDTDTYGTVDLSGTQHNRPSSDYRVSLTRTEDNSDALGLASLISDASGNYSSIEITDTSGKTYSYVADEDSLTDDTFTIVDGVITFKAKETPTRPTGEYTLTYEAFDALTADTTYEGATTQTASITVDSGYGNYGGTSLSYEQILSDLDLTSSSSADDIKTKFAANFTLTDEDGNSYEYGTDYTIIQGSDTDSSTGEHNVLINWLTSGTKPSSGAAITLTYTGRGEGGGETITTDGVKRSATDTINPTVNTSSRPLYSKFTGASEVRIQGNGETFLMGTDFTVSSDGAGYAVINWLENAPSGTPDYEAYFKDATSITVTDKDGNSVTGFTISEDLDGTAKFAMDDSSTLNAGTYTVKVVKGGRTRLYNLTSDGTNMSITSRSSWQTQDNSSAESYTVYVTDSSGTTSFSGSRPAGSYSFSLNSALSYPKASDLEGHTTITQGTKTFYENEDYIINSDTDGNAQIYWLNDRSGGTEWYYPNPGTTYTINYTDDNGNSTSYTASRSARESLNMADYGMTTAGGSLTVQYGSDHSYKLDAEPNYDDDGNAIANTDEHAAIKTAYSIDIADNGGGSFVFNWVTPTLTSRSGLPSSGDELTVEYEYDANTFEITGEAATLLGLNDDVTEANDAELVIDGETVYRASNDIGADYDNELIKGVTIHLKGTGEVSLDIAHDAEKAVESIQTFVDTYNDLMSWMNTRMTESQLDEDAKSTVDSDDFRMRWGLLHGNSLLRQTKSQMRNLTSQNFTFSFTQRKSSEEVYGTMGYNGLRSSSTLRLRIGTKYVDVTIDPTDTLQTIVAKINDDTKGGPMNDIYYDDEGNKLQAPLLRASVENDMLVINSTSSDEITMSGSAAMNALKMNYTYKGLYQIGIETTSDDYGKSGELVFDPDEFMTALEDNPDEVQALMLKFVGQFDTWTKSMLNSSASGETSGTLTREIENIQTQIDSINEYLENYQDRLDRMEENLRTKYGNTETQLSRLTQQASSIAAILNQLNGTASSNNSSS